MFDRFTYKQKNYGLLILLVLMLVVSYKRSFSLSLAALADIDQQTIQKQEAAHATTDLADIQFQILQLDRNLGKTDLPPDQVQQEILSTINRFSKTEHILTSRVEATHQFQTVDFDIYSNLVLVSGSFNGILSLTHHFEHAFNQARLTSIDLYTDQDPLTKKTTLYAKLLFQHYRQKKQ